MGRLIERQVEQWTQDSRAIQTLDCNELLAAFDWPDRPRTWLDYDLLFGTLREGRSGHFAERSNEIK